MITPKPVLDYCYGFESIDELDFEKGNGLIPAVIQNAQTGQVLMVGYMNKEALQKTITGRFVTFYSRDRQKLWTKGEESGNFLHLRAITTDCDKDTLLILVRPDGPTCHKGTVSCFDASPLPDATARYIMNMIK
ncbi:phosphoribosyl-AMP cyclohydrolase [Succinatimonas hippei]|uniref:Histidine biosynthesis bifunctional protein HisIE n=1 Tax=Succinatimonas hippei (strain DSM 22608 / JCM 16073 / KCTC 15190 / YIT 12066) TaxID=762983 RepID=E8LMS5_SUCHY|nr:phosphoribosyl-AMP cyclohydrolase [Succinatimonas hippei]EFY06188.1 phosphoribosyl-AMP cyclohydrolase [Succinatimonas hippei YIT 12066]